MKRVLLVIGMFCVGILMFRVSIAQAQSADVTVTVRIQALGVSVSPTSRDLGTVLAGSVDRITQGAVVVTNTGNVNQRYRLTLGAVPTWVSVEDAPDAAEEFRFSAVFKATQAVAADFEKDKDVLMEGVAKTCDGTVFATTAAQDGYDVAPNATQDLYFNFDAPPSTTVTAQQSLVTTITALAMP